VTLNSGVQPCTAEMIGGQESRGKSVIQPEDDRKTLGGQPEEKISHEGGERLQDGVSRALIAGTQT